jgi:hypothetical protein
MPERKRIAGLDFFAVDSFGPGGASSGLNHRMFKAVPLRESPPYKLALIIGGTLRPFLAGSLEYLRRALDPERMPHLFRHVRPCGPHIKAAQK